MVLTSGLKKIIGTKAFYKVALAFAIPLILQDTVSSFVNLLDNMMIGSLGTEQMSGVAIVNQFINLFTMCIYGGVAGANIFAAQYIGNNDNKNAQHAIRFNFIMVTCFSALFIAVMYLFQDKLISAFLHISSGKGDLQATLQYGKEYLKIMLWQVLPFALATTYEERVYLRRCADGNWRCHLRYAGSDQKESCCRSINSFSNIKEEYIQKGELWQKRSRCGL